mmetsp:Transcript_6344/g.11013  ORF Transcript_6344/g.11013 Transcript_6344/m.11013 type:complete len:208 (-) Transcript_6344:196-819(-)
MRILLLHEHKVIANHLVHLVLAFILQPAELASAHRFARAPLASHGGDISFANSDSHILAQLLPVSVTGCAGVISWSAPIVHDDMLSSSIAQLHALTTVFLKARLLDLLDLSINTVTCALVVRFLIPVSGTAVFLVLNFIAFVVQGPHIVAVRTSANPELFDVILSSYVSVFAGTLEFHHHVRAAKRRWLLKSIHARGGNQGRSRQFE